jgi:hypothetical protein
MTSPRWPSGWSDGLFHAGGFIAMVAGLFLLADAHRRGGFVPKRWWGGLLLGVGGFQLYDGIVQHKLLGLHQIRYHVTIWTLSPMAGKLAVALREAWLAQAGMSRAAVLTRVPVPPPAPGDTRNGSLRARLNPEHLIVAGQGQKPQHLRLRARPAPYRRRRAGPVRAPAARRQASCNR